MTHSNKSYYSINTTVFMHLVMTQIVINLLGNLLEKFAFECLGHVTIRCLGFKFVCKTMG